MSKTLLNRGQTYALKKRFDEAIQDYDEAAKLRPTDAEVFYSRGIAYANKGEDAKAKADMEKALGLKPDYRLARQALDTLEDKAKK